MKNLETILEEQLAVLRKAYDTLDSQAAAESGAFCEMLSMRVGNIDEFHQGLSARIGKVRCLFFGYVL